MEEVESIPVALWRRMREHKISWFSGQGGSFVIALVYLAILKWQFNEDIWRALRATVIAYLLVGGSVAIFLLYREANRLFVTQGKVIANLRVIADLNNTERSNRTDHSDGEFIILAGQLRQFLNARRADYDAEFGGHTIADEYEDITELAKGTVGERARKKSARVRQHVASTLQAYGDRFAPRVLEAHRRLRERGVKGVDHLGKYPTTTNDIETIISELEAASTAAPQLRQNSETAEERYWNVRLQAETPELISKIITGQATPAARAEPEPDVLLELFGGPVVTRSTASSLESVEFVVYNDSADATAMHIHIAELSSGDYYDGGYWGGDAATPAGATTANTKLRFALIPHVEGKRRVEVEPINPGFSTPDRIMQEIGNVPANQRAQDVSVGLWWFIDAARKARVLKAPEPASESERRSTFRRLDAEPIDIPMCVTYSNAQTKRSWERQEVLHYDPRTRAAYVSHGQRQEITGRVDPPTQASQPVITLKVIYSQDHVEVVVGNGGGDAEVWGVLQLTGAVPAPFNDLWCRWAVLSGRAKIARGEERRAVLADRVRDPKRESSGQSLRWHIYCYGGVPMTLISDELNQQPSTDPTGDIVIEGAIFSDPESANGAQSFRVTLKPSGAFPNEPPSEPG